MSEPEAGIFRGTVSGKARYCRVLIRRKRAPLEEAIAYFAEAIIDGDEIIKEFSAAEQVELRAQQACFVTAVVAMRNEQARRAADDGSKEATP